MAQPQGLCLAFCGNSLCSDGTLCTWVFLLLPAQCLTFPEFVSSLIQILGRDPAIPLLGIYSNEMETGYERNICAPALMAALFTTAKMWKQLFEGWMDTEHAYRHNEILFSREEEGNPAICDNLNEPWGHCAEVSQTEKEKQIWFHHTSMQNLKEAKLTETK